MERFVEYKDFYGALEAVPYVRAFDEFFRLAAKIHQQLGKQGELLETYLSIFFAAALRVCEVPEAARGDELSDRITRALDGQAGDLPFYGAVKRYVKAHPLPYTSRETRRHYYAVALFGKYLSSRAGERRAYYRERLRPVLDTAECDALRREINGIVGPELMERLNVLFWQGFLFVKPMAAFMQCMCVTLMRNLLAQDRVTGRPVLGLWLDELAPKGSN